MTSWKNLISFMSIVRDFKCHVMYLYKTFHNKSSSLLETKVSCELETVVF